MPPNPKPIPPLVKHAKAYDAKLRRSYFNPLMRQLRGKLAQAEAVNQAYQALQAGITSFEAQPRAGVPVRLISQSLNDIDIYNRRRMFQSFRAALGVDIRPLLLEAPVRAFVQERIAENVDLIKTIPKRMHESLRGRIAETFADAPFDRQAMSKLLSREFKSSGYNLRRIVRTESAKLNGRLTRMRQQQVGVEQYKWQTSEDEAVRASHAANNGLTFDWASPPATGEPGEAIQCRCVAIPIITATNRARLKSN